MTEHDESVMEKTGGKLLTRRTFLKLSAGSGVGLLLAGCGSDLATFLTPNMDSPLEHYPDRDWEKVYRNIFSTDSEFHFLCAPNDTHNCLLKAHVKNGVITRISPSYRYGEATDLYGNRASSRWDPRICQKGIALVRRIYGDRRVKGAMVRKGFKEWVEAGCPRDPETAMPPVEYFKRGDDKWLKLSWDSAFELGAKALHNIAVTYSGPKGSQFLLKQGYDPAMVDTLHESGTQTLKFRGGMALLGATRIFGYYRFANMLALLDQGIRDVPKEKVLGARGWDSYSWHTDLPPGHPMVTGAQTNEFDLFAVERAKLLLVWGMNWIATKMPDAHWLTEARLKGTRVVSITVEYPATACRSDEVIVIRPGTDPALALSVSQVIIPEAWGFSSSDLDCETRQVRNVQLTVDELLKTQHPLMKDPEYRFILHTPKYRHGVHTTPADTDMIAVWFGPFGDIYRRDKRLPFVMEMYLDINPLDAKELGVEDGDYIYIDADPEDRPYKGWKGDDPNYKVARLLCRARYYPGTPQKVTRMWHNNFCATIGSVKGHETRADGLAKNPETHYQAMFRYGSHQSTTRAWLRPTLMTDSLVRKDNFGQTIGKGFAADIHCANGAPREGFVKITRAEVGVREVLVQSIHDGKYVSFRLTWQDETKNETPRIMGFADGAAIQFPVRKEDFSKQFMGEEKYEENG
jgi:nitrate reductase alpha subunit